MLLLSIALAVSTAASAAELSPAWGPLRWGMTKTETLAVLRTARMLPNWKRSQDRPEFDLDGFHCFVRFSSCDRLEALSCGGGVQKTRAEADARGAALRRSLARFPSTRADVKTDSFRNDTSVGPASWEASAELVPISPDLSVRDADRLTPFLGDWPPNWTTSQSRNGNSCSREFRGVGPEVPAPREKFDTAAPQITIHYYPRDGYEWRQQMDNLKRGYWQAHHISVNGLPGTDWETFEPRGRMLDLLARSGMFLIAASPGPDRAAGDAAVGGFLKSFRPALAQDREPLDLEAELLRSGADPRPRFLEITAPAAGATLRAGAHVVVSYRHKGLRTVSFTLASKTKRRPNGGKDYGGGPFPAPGGLMLELPGDMPPADDYWLTLRAVPENGAAIEISTGPFSVHR